MSAPRGADAAAKAGASRHPPDDGAFLPGIAETQAAVALLLDFAVSRNNIDVGAPLIARTVPLLRKDGAHMTADEEATLWACYNSLALMVAPATVASVRLAWELDAAQRPSAGGHARGAKFPWAALCRRQIRNAVASLVLLVALYVVIQVYVILLTDVLRNAEKNNAELQEVTTQIEAMQQANPQLKDEDALPRPLLSRRDTAELKVDAAYSTLVNFSRPWLWLYQPRLSAGGIDQPKDALTRVAIQQGAPSVLRSIAPHILPLVLGLLGAIAFITRRMLSELAAHTYLLDSGRRYWMRLALGGLLGVISGIILAPDSAELRAFSLPLVAFAFLMGYSVEFAFSVFDTLIERGRKALKPQEAPAQAKPGAGQPAAAD